MNRGPLPPRGSSRTQKSQIIYLKIFIYPMVDNQYRLYDVMISMMIDSLLWYPVYSFILNKTWRFMHVTHVTVIRLHKYNMMINILLVLYKCLTC